MTSRTTDHNFIEKISINKEGAYNYRRRRHEDWTENYTLYRDKVQMNRLIQRQSVNIPIIKTTIKTLLKDIDDPPMLYFTSLDNNDQKEVYYNEYWKHCYRNTKLVIKDIVDKRQAMLFGRSFKSLNIVNGIFHTEVVDPQDILIDRYVDPSDIDSARFIIREHIYKPLSSLRMNPLYDTGAVRRLQEFYKSDKGLLRAQANQLDFVEKNKRMADMGVIDVMNPILGEKYVELNEAIIYEWNEYLKEDQLTYAVIADGMEVLFKAPLEQIIGPTREDFWRNHYPLVTWGDEAERTDFWSDGVADMLRTPNKVVNSWFSQTVENRTLRNFGMNYFNASMSEEGFTPQSFTPEPWGWYPIPAGDKPIGELIQHVDIPDLTDDMEQMNFIIAFAEKASASTATQQGDTQSNVTLGDIKLALQNAQDWVKSMAVYYTQSWEEFGLKYTKLLEAAPHMLDEVTIHRRGRLTKKMYSRTVSPDDWQSKMGYTVEVQMKNQKDNEDMNKLQWMNAARSIMPQNQIVDEEYKKTILEHADLPAEKIAEALKLDKQLQAQPSGQMAQTRPPMESINYKDLPPQGQQQMAAQANIQLQPQQQPQLPPPQAQIGPGNGAAMPQIPAQTGSGQTGLRPMPQIGR